jgi:uncharacterized protein YjbJ (UPF0337 family)
MDGKFLQDNWTDMRGHLRSWWDELTDDDLDLVDGDEERMIGILQKRYGYTEEMAKLELAKLMADYSPESTGE